MLFNSYFEVSAGLAYTANITVSAREHDMYTTKDFRAQGILSLIAKNEPISVDENTSVISFFYKRYHKDA